MGWYYKNGAMRRTCSSKSSFKGYGSCGTCEISNHNINDEYQKCLQSIVDTNLSSTVVNGININPGDKFTYEAEFSIFQRFLSEFGFNECFKPKRISIYRNGIYDHDIIPTRIAGVIGYYRLGLLDEADDYCKKLNKAAGNVVDTHRYDIKCCGPNYYTIKFHPNFGWANEYTYKYDSLIDCLKHIVVNSYTYSATEIGYELKYYNPHGCIINSVNIQNTIELNRYIQNNIQLPF